jgi:hypothetical protein
VQPPRTRALKMSSTGRKDVDGQEAHHRRTRRIKGDAEGHGRRGGRAREDRADVRLRPRHGRAGARNRPEGRAGPDPSHLVRHAGLREKRKVICFFQDAAKFKARYATIGFSDKANLDDGNMWPTAFALTKLTTAEEKRIVELVKQAVS